MVDPFLSQSPDIDNIRDYNKNRTGAFASYVASIHEAMRTSFAVPMPHRLQPPLVDERTTVLSWTPAYDVTQSNTLSYDLQVASSVAFEADSIVFTANGIDDADGLIEYPIDNRQLPPGKLFFRVTARASSEPDRFWQVAENTLRIDGETWFGVEEFELP